MVYFLIGLIVGFIIGGVIVYLIMWPKKTAGASKEATSNKETPFINPKVETRKENLAKLEELMNGKSKEEKITNDEVQTFLKVSDATAERYLQELEGQGKLKQFGEVGKEVYYQKV